MTSLTFRVRGLPIAQGTARAFVAGGKARIATDSNRTSSPVGAWRADLAAGARDAFGQAAALTGPVGVDVTFVFPRPKGHYLPSNRTRPEPVVRLDAPRFHTAKPDADKLARTLLDALTHVVIVDDSQVAVLSVRKIYEDEADRPGAEVSVRTLETTR